MAINTRTERSRLGETLESEVDMEQTLRGDGSFGFVAVIQNDDILVDNVRATWFGGPNDPGDNGQTASGIRTDTNPIPQGCALPMDGFNHPATDGSPLPRMAWKTTRVEVTNLANGRGATVPLIDLGPSKFAA